MSLRKIARTISNHYDQTLGCTTIYSWIQKYVPKISEYVNTLSPELSDTWHTDEVFVPMKNGIEYKTKGKKSSFKIAFLWNVMDRKTRFLLASKLNPCRDTIGANNALGKAMQVSHGSYPDYLFCDGASAYRKEEFGKLKGFENLKIIKNTGVAKPHATNNRIERLNGTCRERIKVQ